MEDKWGILPNQYEMWRTALGFLNQSYLEDGLRGFGPGTEHELETILSEGQPDRSAEENALRLAVSMTALAKWLIKIRHDETGKTPGETFNELGQLLTPAPEGE